MVNAERLKDIVGEKNVRDDIVDLYIYGSDAPVHKSSASVIARPKKIEEMQEIMRYANAELIPVIPRGAGSCMSGHAVPVKGGIIMDLNQMNKILEIRPEDRLCKVEPGVIDDDLNRALEPYGVFYPPSPVSSRATTIGGEIANNASGIRSGKYGAARDSVLGMKVVLANGDLVNLGSNTRVEAGGCQLDRLMVGSEGTLGIIAEVTLLLTPLPEFRYLALAKFRKLEEAGEAITDVTSSGILPSMCELMDNTAIAALNKTFKLGLPDVESILLFETDGMVREAVDCEMENIKKICAKHNGFGIETGCEAEDRARIYSGRRSLFAALARYKKELVCTSLIDDVLVPISQTAECIREIRTIARRNKSVVSVIGHCAAGVLHTVILIDPAKKEHSEAAKRVACETYNHVHNVGGAISVNHGIAFSRDSSWKKEEIDLLRITKAIKNVLDPNNILSPHKLRETTADSIINTRLRYPVTV